MLDDAQMASLRESFKTEVQELLAELEAALMDMEVRPEDRNLTDRAFRALHSIKGSGTMFGFEEMSEFVHEIENVFDRVRRDELKVTRTLIDLTLASKDELQAMAGRSALDGRPRKEATDELLEGFRQYGSEGDTGAAPQEGDLAGGKAGPGAPEADVAADAQGAAGPTGSHRFQIRFVPSSDTLRRGSDPMLILDELRSLGTCTVTIDTERVPTLDEIAVDECYLGWEIDITTDQPRERIDEVFVFVADESVVEISELAPESSPAPIPETVLGQIPAAPSRPAIQAESTSQDTASSTVDATIRVPSARLDSLVDLVGELVTVQARLSAHAQISVDPVVMSISETIERLTDELRDNAMSLRMLPIGATFSKLRRLVRDLSGQLGKDIRLETSGEETELDKTVIERLGDPLVHIIRNCIDHGIETPATRLEAGKDAVGRIRLRAAHEGATVVVEVADDGQGLDLERIRSIAVDRGIIRNDAEISDAEARNLIFAPGFSTAAQVSEVSGRGVGMDVVRQTIDGLGGSIEVSSNEGSGTSVTLRLPLTLAIIEGLLVKEGDQNYVVPLPVVQELLEFDRTQVHSENNRRLVEVRGTLVPYVDLRTYFESYSDASARSQIVIVEWEGSRIGLVVDEVIGEQKTVIKSLGMVSRRIESVSGATILGDGSVALILDIPKLILNATDDSEPSFQEAV